VTVTSTLGRWEDDEEPAQTYFSFEYDWPSPEETADFSRSRENNLIACASRDGSVFCSRSSADEFVITGFNPDGSRFFHVTDDGYRRVRKPDEELRAEVEFYNGYFGRALGRPVDREIRPDPLRTAIERMFVDGEDRLWVQLGYLPGIVFRVYDMDGEVLFHAALDYPGDPYELIGWTVVVDGNGFLAWDSNPEDYSRIYMLELVEADVMEN
jgi:hypothetical protein